MKFKDHIFFKAYELMFKNINAPKKELNEYDYSERLYDFENGINIMMERLFNSISYVNNVEITIYDFDKKHNSFNDASKAFKCLKDKDVTDVKRVIINSREPDFCDHSWHFHNTWFEMNFENNKVLQKSSWETIYDSWEEFGGVK